MAQLAASQRTIVLAAMRFPRVRTVVYSTCSVHRAENEDVVASVLEEAASEGWRLVRCLPEWPTRGLAEAPGGDLCVRAGEGDATHGFFVARFEKSDEPAVTTARASTGKRAEPTGGGEARKPKKKKLRADRP